MEIQQYRELDHWSYSKISDYLKGVVSFKRKWIDKEEQFKTHKPAMVTGDLIDTLLTSPDTFDSRFLVKDYTIPTGQLLTYTEALAKATTMELEESAEEYAHRIVGAKNRTLEWFKTEFNKSCRDYYEYLLSDVTYVTSFEYDRAVKTVNCLLSNPETGKLLEGSQRQKAFVKENCFGNYTFKGLLDIYKVGSIADLKVLSEESPKQFESKIRMFNYHIQDAVYSEITGEDRLQFIAVNPNYPEYPMIWVLSDKDREFARNEVIRCLREIEQRVESNNWYYPITGMYGVANVFNINDRPERI